MLKYELRKLFNNRLLWLCILMVLSIWGFVLNTTQLWAPGNVILKSLNFWNKLGSLAVGFIILIIIVRIFSKDKEEGVEEVFNTTMFGRMRLFKTRLKAAILFYMIVVLILTSINLGLTAFFMGSEQRISPYDIPLGFYYMIQLMTIVLGGSIFILWSACICDNFKSHNITLIICGLFYGVSYITHTSVISRFSIHWFLEKGFFSHIIRGNILNDELWEIIFWVVWYSILIYGIMILNKRLRLRRREL